MDKYQELLSSIQERIRKGQLNAALSVNAELLTMYWDIGQIILKRQNKEGWGTGVIPRLARDIHNEISDVKGFSERNIGYMVKFAREYDASQILQQPIAKLELANSKLPAQQLPLPILQLNWSQNILVMEKVKNWEARRWYMEKTIEQGWGRETLASMIKNKAHVRQGNATTNFERTLQKPHSSNAQEMLKDPYIFDFLTLAEPYQEGELESGLVRHLEKFLLELGAGFAFIGRQYHLSVSDQDFYIDLLFYHLKLRCFIVIELKKGKFKPEYAGKINFYCSLVDDILRHQTDNQTIGLLLCQSKDRVIAEYALRNIYKPIGVSEYDLSKALPDNLKSSLPSIEEIESLMSGE